MRANLPSLFRRVGVLVAALAILLGFFQLVLRPWFVHWGSTQAERVAELPGDGYLTANGQTTRAITIDAPASAVWPWIAQLGQDRGGFYSYDLLEDLVGAQMPNIDTLQPELQTWRVGDKLWMYPPHRLDGAGHAVLSLLVPGESLVFVMRQIGTPRTSPRDATWAFTLRSLDTDHARLIVRGRGAGERSAGLLLIDRLAFEPVHFMMERKMLEGIKARAEGHRSSPTTGAMELGVFGVCFYLMLAASRRLLCEPGAEKMFYLVLALGFLFQLLTLVQPPWFVGAIPVAVLGFYVGADTLVRPRDGTPRKHQRTSDLEGATS